jgi:hypothetical protein
MENRKVTSLIWRLVPVGGEGSKEKVKEGDCGRNVMYSCMEVKK